MANSRRLLQDLRLEIQNFFREKNENRTVEDTVGLEVVTCLSRHLHGITPSLHETKQGILNIIKNKKGIAKLLRGLITGMREKINDVNDLPLEAKCFLLASQLGITIFVLSRVSRERTFRWFCYPPLFKKPSYDNNGKETVTLFRSGDDFFPIASKCPAPNAAGYIGDAEKMLQGKFIINDTQQHN